MSTTCLIVAHNFSGKIDTINHLIEYSNVMKFHINFDIIDILSEMPYVSLSKLDLAFELCDKADISGYGIFMDLDGYSVNGIVPSLPLRDRIKIISYVMSIVSPYSNIVELYIQGGRPSINDYATYRTCLVNVQKIIKLEYDKAINSDCILPDIHIII